MFKCGLCSLQSQPGERARRVVLETRPASYDFRPAAHANGNDDPGGRGVEVVREVLAHVDCKNVVDMKAFEVLRREASRQRYLADEAAAEAKRKLMGQARAIVDAANALETS